MDEAAHRIPTNMRPILILEALAEADGPLTPTEIGRRVGLPKQTIHRLCTTMVAEQLLVFDADGKRLRAARRARRLGLNMLQGADLAAARHQILQDVARAVGETVNFVVPEPEGMRYLDRVETAWPFRVQLPIGTHVPFHCTASGKAYLASLPSSKRRRLVTALDLARHTARTITDAQDLLRELDRVRAEGHACDNEEFFDDMVAIAVPVKDRDGRYIASLAFHGPRQRLSLDEAVARRVVILEAAGRLATLFET